MADHQFQTTKIMELRPDTENYSEWINVLSEIFTHKRNENKSEGMRFVTVDDVIPEAQFIARQESSFIFAQDLETKRFIGYGIMVPDIDDTKVISLADAYVLPEFRRRGVFGEITDSAIEIAQQRGFREILAIPTTDGNSRRVLERKGYKNIEGKPGDLALIRRLSTFGQETPRITEQLHSNTSK